MIRSMNTAEKAMQLQQTRIDTLANNLANVNTTGFRQILTRVSTVDGAGDRGQNAAANTNQLDKTQRRPGLDDNWVNSKPLVMSHATDTRRGDITTTGRDTDVAIMGPGFFAVESATGERFTRGGSFTLNAQKQLVTPDGLPVLGEGGPIVLDGDSFSIESDGTIMVDGSVANKLKIVNFADPTRLEHQGNNIMRTPPEMEAQPLPAEEVIVAQGHIEGSNVNPIDTLVAMITAQRAFEVQQKTLTTEDDMLSKTVNKLPRVG
ncbi:MAG: flagellar basal-body rod protein FlgF [bacterium]|nr:flagellar basal-body rod protein FlgF [bacterium]